MIENLHVADFAAQLNTTFRIAAEGLPPVDLELVEASGRPSTPRQEQFSLLFAGPPEPHLEQGLYDLDHAAFGRICLFLVPVARDARGFQYEAVFNRLL